MNIEVLETQEMIAEAIRKFGATHIKPYMMDWDERQLFPVELF